MSKICPTCNHEWPDNFQSCPLDSTPLIFKQQSNAGFSLNLGDANAVSGGVNLSDNHSINTTNTHNVDSHNVITNNITQIEREKTVEEIKHEKEFAFREACQNIYRNGLITIEDKRSIEDLQYKLGLDKTSASQIIAEVSRRSEKKSEKLSPVHQITYNNIKTAILANRLDIINRLLAQMKAMVKRYLVDEVQYTYYMLNALLHPNECVVEYEEHHEDKYWQSFWTSIAYRRIGKVEESEILVADLSDKWDGIIPEENVFVLATINAILDEDYNTAKSLYENVAGEYSLLLSELITCIYILLYGDAVEDSDLRKMQQECLFYSVNLFDNCKLKLHDKRSSDKKNDSDDALDKSKQQEPVDDNVELAQEAPILDSIVTKQEQHEEVITKERIITPSKTDTQPISKEKEENPKIELDIMANPILLFDMQNKSTIEQKRVYDTLLEHASKGNGKAGAYLGYFYLNGVIVSEDIQEAEKRILNSNYQNDVILIQLLIDLYNKKGMAVLADVWKRKLNTLKK